MEALTRFFTALMRKYLPDPFVFAIILTFLTMVLAIFLEGKGLVDVISYWGGGFWNLLAFTTQMAVILAMGYVLAKTPLVEKILDYLVSLIKTPRAAIAVATLVGAVGSYLNWGFGLIIGALVARKFAEKIRGIHYPLIMASAYSGFCLYGLGITGTIPMLIATKGHFLEKEMGIIPLDQTIFSAPILVLSVITLITLPIVNMLAMPRNKENIIELDPTVFAFEEKAKAPAGPAGQPLTLAERMNNSYILGWLIGLMGIAYLVKYFAKGGGLDLNIVNFIIIFVGILLLGTPSRYIGVLNEGIKTVSGILLQYPFYAGIMAIMAGSGLVNTIAKWFVDISTPQTLPFWGLISSFVINFFAPSAGGHWAIQGPFMVEAAKNLNADMAKTAMSVMMGNAWNDLVQPFWLLPTLAISRLQLRDIMGYTVLDAIWVCIVFSVGILIWGYM
ncbi:MAG: short-chain fatty acid transporter [Pelotomaculum sp.]|nr:short-chain fatty acid transporter [Pelotomaculum sp.]